MPNTSTRVTPALCTFASRCSDAKQSSWQHGQAHSKSPSTRQMSLAKASVHSHELNQRSHCVVTSNMSGNAPARVHEFKQRRQRWFHRSSLRL